jgi:6-phosphogluconate dehydrogenase (decarboxylating)
MPIERDHVRSVVTRDGATILDMEQDLMIALNSSGATVWQGLENGESVEVIAERLASQAGADRSLVEADVRAFMEELRRERLIAGKG